MGKVILIRNDIIYNKRGRISYTLLWRNFQDIVSVKGEVEKLYSMLLIICKKGIFINIENIFVFIKSKLELGFFKYILF